MAVEVEVTPTSPSAGDGVVITVRGEVPEGSVIEITSDGDQLAASPAFGIDNAPEGTGAEGLTLKIAGGTSGDFTLSFMDPDTEHPDPVYYESDPIYYRNDAPSYTYPDIDDLVEAIEEGLPDDVTVSADRWGSTITILIGGKWSGRNVIMTVDSTDIVGAETVTQADVEVAGPFVFGPTFLPADDYEVDVKNSAGVSLLGSPVEFTVSA